MTTLTLLSSETSEGLLTKINDALSDGKFLYGTTTVLPGESRNPVRFSSMSAILILPAEQAHMISGCSKVTWGVNRIF